MSSSLQGQVKLPWRDFLSPWNLQKEAGGSLDVVARRPLEG